MEEQGEASPRRIAHLDMDAYFASVELLRFPHLRGLPLVIGGRPTATAGEGRLKDYAGRGVVTTATYEARAFGIHSGMGLMKAAALAPDAYLLPNDHETYRRISRTFKEAVLQIAPRMEDRGIDEIYLDLTDLPGSSEALGRQLKAAVKEATGLTCSIGITPNKLLSKLASEFQKPDGLTLLSMADIPTRVWPLPVGALNGIGPRAAERLEVLGIRTLGELAQADPAVLCGHFGQAYGQWLAAASRGQDDRPLVLERDPKSMSRETTFERDLHPRRDREALTAILLRLCDRLADDLARKELQAGALGVKVKYADFSQCSRDLSLGHPIHRPDQLRDAARACLRRVPLDAPLRLLGLKASHLQPRQDTEPPALFPELV